MPVVVEYFFRPKTDEQRLLAQLLGIPTFGLLRSGSECTEYGRPWENVVAFIAKDHVNAEIVGLSVNQLYASGMSEISAALAGEGLFGFFTRRDATGQIKRRVIMPRKFPGYDIFDAHDSGHHLDKTVAAKQVHDSIQALKNKHTKMVEAPAIRSLQPNELYMGAPACIEVTTMVQEAASASDHGVALDENWANSMVSDVVSGKRRFLGVIEEKRAIEGQPATMTYRAYVTV